MSAVGEWFADQVDAHLNTLDEDWEADWAEEERRTEEQHRLEEQIHLNNLMYYHTHYPQPRGTAG